MPEATPATIPATPPGTTPGATLLLALQPIQPAFPAVVDTAFSTAVTASEAGGAGHPELLRLAQPDS